jgi:hypothetical protein
MDSYNCQGSPDSAYGEGGYGTCSSVGAPNTGFFREIVDNGSYMIIIPIVIAVIATAGSILYSSLRKRRQARSTPTDNQG